MIFSWGKSTQSALEAMRTLDAPWQDGRPSIHSIVERAIAQYGQDACGHISLPEPDEDEDKLRVVAGGWDVLFGMPERSPGRTAARSIAAAISKVVRAPTRQSAAHLISFLKDDHVIGVVDDVLDRAVNSIGGRQEVMAELARRLISESPDVEPVKLAIAMLGRVGTADDVPLLLMIGRFEELTLFSVVACRNLLPDPEAAIWELAKTTNGWGRIQAVERLADTKDPAIKSWMLRDGFRNAIMYEYLACICARAGELYPAIAAETVDDELLTAAAEILEALPVGGGPAEDMADYNDGAKATVACLRHLAARPSLTVRQIGAALNIRTVADEPYAERLRTIPGWSAEVFLNVRSLTNAILQNPANRVHVEADLMSEDSLTFGRAADLAKTFNIDAWPLRFERQRKSLPHDQWFWLMGTPDRDRIEQVLNLARDQLDLKTIGSGPLDTLGLGAKYKDDNALDFILQGLWTFPGLGWDLVKVALHGRTVRARNMAVRALYEWGEDGWPPGARAEVESAIARELRDDVKERMRNLLDGKSID